jgi:hypothetical protein
VTFGHPSLALSGGGVPFHQLAEYRRQRAAMHGAGSLHAHGDDIAWFEHDHQPPTVMGKREAASPPHDFVQVSHASPRLRGLGMTFLVCVPVQG